MEHFAGRMRAREESVFLHGPKARKRPGSLPSSKPLIVGRISGRSKKFAVACMGEVREVPAACPQRGRPGAIPPSSGQGGAACIPSACSAKLGTIRKITQ
ncbi:MAG: hypothetical protein LBV50_09600, partial [Novosphingobium sp.]|nr:hypothetical protein [Novosphingobium sp.]